MDEFEKFEQVTFWSAVSASYDPLFDPLYALRGDWRMEGQSEIDRQVFAERAIRELYAQGSSTSSASHAKPAASFDIHGLKSKTSPPLIEAANRSAASFS